MSDQRATVPEVPIVRRGACVLISRALLEADEGAASTLAARGAAPAAQLRCLEARVGAGIGVVRDSSEAVNALMSVEAKRDLAQRGPGALVVFDEARDVDPAMWDAATRRGGR